VFNEQPSVALAVYAHPDDADVAAGGALATWSRAGTSTHLVIICDGAKGSHESATEIGELRARRAQELEVAANVLGVSSVTCLRRADGEFDNDLALRESLVHHVRRLRPDVVLGPDPTATFFGGVYVNHRDHRETGWALLDAVAPASAMPLYFPDAGAAHLVEHLLLSGTHEPDVVVDVTDAIEDKIKAVLAHGSQVAGDPEWVRQVVLARAEQAGREIGITHGESFRHVALAP
jgi:LmbE family N-acetylglucosaminyl deacetylase